jgi:hypothetical protein
VAVVNAPAYRAPSRLLLSQVYDNRFVDDEAVEVTVGREVYIVGADAGDGETVIRPHWIHASLMWRMEGYTVLDCIELLQTLRVCPDCWGYRVVEEECRSSDPADVREIPCPECDGKGWIE